ncbi:SAM-dependent methyltransferase [Actinosynnema sp. ALI-1.44]|uniref:class I SAM-dependent methyltransferase n=1 Tax=Actinosynnema sp. ALI-1.44 TaxID=1933779 RepID=UPI00097C18E3|nr:class I SAM-dependent methyltransferase [Actinosynnema sp. ALI-1.44]ONI76356.1 SAM-dependent methyltransferase [Actinosynnema sp. ALI-1.44]
MLGCRLCGGLVDELLDLGRQPLANSFPRPDQTTDEFFYRLAMGACRDCSMMQLLEEVPRDLKYHDGYPYRASGSATHRDHFTSVATNFLARELSTKDAFVVEIGCNDGVMLARIAKAGVRHLGVEPAGGVAELAAAKGIDVLREFFEEETAVRIRSTHGPADVIFAANTICHIPYADSLMRGVAALLKPGGIFVFEEPYLGTVINGMAFDQLYDEHFYFFTVRSVQSMARRFGFELIDAEPTPLHGGSMRYTLALPGQRARTANVRSLLAQEEELTKPDTYRRFRSAVERIRHDLVGLLEQLKQDGRTVVGYGAPGKVTTVTNYCGIGPDLVPYVCDSTPSKQHRLVPGTHIPVRPPDAFRDPYPDYALLFAWNHADEIIAKEQAFLEAGGSWILYVPEVRVVRHVPAGR